MTILWPAILPAAPLVEGFSEDVPVTAIRTEMEQGPAKMRRRTTAGVSRMMLRYLLRKSQVDTLEIFFNETLKGGTLPFTAMHPRKATSIVCRFIAPPHYVQANEAFFVAEMLWEVLP